MIKNGYPSAKVVMGMQSSDFTSGDFNQAVETVRSLSTTYRDFAGVFNWEYFDSPPGGKKGPLKWANMMSSILHSSHDTRFANDCHCNCCVIM